MKAFFFALTTALFCSLFTSCESLDSRRAGGAAFDDSHLSRKLDANAHLDDPDGPRAGTYNEWQERSRDWQ